MPRPTGLPKTGGRTKGTPNRRSFNFGDRLQELGFDPVAELLALYPKMTTKEKSSALLSLLPFLYPRLKSVEHTVQQPPLQARFYRMTDEQKREELRAIVGRLARPLGYVKVREEGALDEDE